MEDCVSGAAILKLSLLVFSPRWPLPLPRSVVSSTWFCAMLRRSAKGLIASVVLCCAGFAQEASLVSSSPLNSGIAVEPPTAARTILPEVPGQHRFWDRENFAFFGAVAASSAADFAATRANLENGGKELNPVVRPLARSTAGLAVNFTGKTAGVIGLSYFFHKTGHHKLERLTSMVNIGASTTAVAYDLTHR